MFTARPILVIEDDAALREALMEYLEETGDFLPFGAGTLAEAGTLLDSAPLRFDSIILDVHLPDGDGVGFCMRLRDQGHNMPVIMLTGSATAADVVRGLGAGATEYLAKPFRASDLIARLQPVGLADDKEDALGPVCRKVPNANECVA
jgi:DNA-binding response OmpR family regulator